MRSYLLILFCCIASAGFSQDLTGIWRGHFQSSNSRYLELIGDDDRYKFEVQLDHLKKTFSGVTYSYKTTVFYGKASARGTLNPSTKKVLLEELKIVEVRMAGGSDACIMTCFLQYSKSGEEEFLEGTYTSMNTRDSSNCGKGTVFLRRVVTSDFYKEPFLVKRENEKAASRKSPVVKNNIPNSLPKNPIVKKPPVKNPPEVKSSTTKKPAPQKTTPTIAQKKPVPPPVKKDQVNTKTAKVDSVKKSENKSSPASVTPKVLISRENELVRTITTDVNEIIVNIYDNGTIDNDTVSVYLDKKLVVDNQRLTEKPITVKFKLDETIIYHELVMVAENLGEIPPNTSLMVVKAGTNQYEVRISSTQQKNAVVIFKYERVK